MVNKKKILLSPPLLSGVRGGRGQRGESGEGGGVSKNVWEEEGGNIL